MITLMGRLPWSSLFAKTSAYNDSLQYPTAHWASTCGLAVVCPRKADLCRHLSRLVAATKMSAAIPRPAGNASFAKPQLVNH